MSKQQDSIEQQIKHMANRFLHWKLPDDFSPDCGIRFDADAEKKLNPRNARHEPVGTNLLTYSQAEAMVRYMIEGHAGSQSDGARTSHKDYQQAALRTLSDQNFLHTINPDLLHAAMGLATESGELLDALKRRAFYGKPIDEVNVIEELGDLMWYIAVACHALGTTIDAACAANIEKLKRRFPDRFTSEHAINRDLSAERQALEGEAAA